MPKVKKAKARKSGGRGKSSPSFIERVRGAVEKYTLAGVAGGIVILVAVAAILWSGGYIGLLGERIERTASNAAVGAGFEIKRVTVVGRRQAGLDEIEGALGPVLGQSSLHLSLNEARARIEQLGWVRVASVSRLLPDTLNISIHERAPAAVWQIGGALHLVDIHGAVIRDVGAYEYSQLPLVVGAGAPESASDILTALDSHPAIRERTSAIVRISERRWNLRLRNGADIKLPETGFAEALDILETMDDVHGTLDQEIEYIDLRDPERMVVRPATTNSETESE